MDINHKSHFKKFFFLIIIYRHETRYYDVDQQAANGNGNIVNLRCFGLVQVAAGARLGGPPPTAPRRAACVVIFC